MEFDGSNCRTGQDSSSSGKGLDGGGGFWWKALLVLVVLAAIVVVIVAKSSRSPRGEKRGLREAAEFPPTEVVASVNGQTITLARLQSELQGLPPQYRSEYVNQKQEFLEELITRSLLLREAKRLKVEESATYKELLSAHGTHAGHEEEALINALLRTHVVEGIRVSEEELRGFYEEHKDQLPQGLAFDVIKEGLRNSALQQKQYEAVEKYISGLRENAEISRNEGWIKAQKGLTADNPLDKAFVTGRPVVADLGRGTCIPCKMMKPILDDLAKEYRGKAEILIIDVGDYPFLARRCRVRVIPTQIFYDASGNEVYRHEGFMSKEDIREQLAKLGVE